MRTLKTFILTGLSMIILSQFAKAQSGIYIEQKNYEKGFTIYQIPCISKFSNSDLYNFYHKKYINLSAAEEPKRFKKKDIWGYRDCKGFDYKIENDLHYQILENDEMVIYKLSFPHGATFQEFSMGIHPKYYFSKNLDSEIIPLTLENLSKTYKANSKYLKAIKNYLNANNCLYCFDTHTKSYIINKLLKQSRNEVG